MQKINQYIQAATRENTRKSYRSAIQHFEVSWGGFLPATADNVARYLADHAEVLSISTLRLRTAALAQWHIEQGFPDPTKMPIVKKVLKGIRELHPQMVKQAKPLQLETLSDIVTNLDNSISHTVNHSPNTLMRLYRDKALLLMGFWRGFRSEELCRLEVEFIKVEPNKGLTIFLHRSKGDRQSIGRTFFTPALEKLCPTQAYQDWLMVSKIEAGPVFRSINRWGTLSEIPLHPNSIIPILRSLMDDASIKKSSEYTSHSLRRGFASWASDNNWDLKSLMEYVGWKDPNSALKYLEVNRHQTLFIGQ